MSTRKRKRSKKSRQGPSPKRTPIEQLKEKLNMTHEQVLGLMRRLQRVDRGWLITGAAISAVIIVGSVAAMISQHLKLDEEVL